MSYSPRYVFLSIEFDFNLFLIPQGNNVAMFVNEKAVETLIAIFRMACHEILKSTLEDKTILGKIITFHKNVSSWSYTTVDTQCKFTLQALKFRWNTRKMMDREGLDSSVAALLWRAKSCKFTSITEEWQAQDQNPGSLPANSSSGSVSHDESYRNHFASNASRIA